MSVYFDMLSINVSRQPADHGGFISIFFRVKSLQINWSMKYYLETAFSKRCKSKNIFSVISWYEICFFDL